MRTTKTVMPVLFALLMSSCHVQGSGEWEKGMDKRLKSLGHRNWILIADAAFPAYSNSGTEIILAEDDHLSVLKSMLRSIEKSGHIRPVIYLDQELAYVSDKQSPGISKFRKKLNDQLEKLKPRSLPHEDLLERLAETAKTYKVIVLKTTMKLPYTSVFIELDCGYWDREQERELRHEMAKPKKKALL
jgi:D-ribose pyranose/furanose isomerase RbsD